MIVFRRGNSKTYHYRFQHLGKIVQKSTHQRDKEKAKRMAAAEQTRLSLVAAGLESPLRAIDSDSDNQTVGQLLDGLKARFEENERKNLPKRRGNGRPTVQNLSLIEKCRGLFGKRSARSLTADDLRNYVSREVEKGAALATAQRVVQMIKRAFTLAELTPPAVKIEDESANTREGFFTDEQFDKVVKNLPADLRDFVRFAYLVGWRKGAINTLTWNDVSDGMVYLRSLHSKNGKPYKVPIVGDLAGIIARRRKARNVIGCDLVFHRDGEPVREIRKSWATACAKAGVPGRLFHDLRRCGARNLIRSGVAQSVAMRVTGHETDSMFRRYAIVDTEDLKAAIEKVSKLKTA